MDMPSLLMRIDDQWPLLSTMRLSINPLTLRTAKKCQKICDIFYLQNHFWENI